MCVQQLVRGTSSAGAEPVRVSKSGGKPGRPKGSRNKNKCEVVLADSLKQVQTMVKGLLADIGCSFPVSYLVLDGFFGHNNALQMTKQCGLFLISKLRSNAALYFSPEKSPHGQRGRPAIYGPTLQSIPNSSQIPRLYRDNRKYHN